MLLERPGEMVTREELQRSLWPADTFVDFDHSLNSAVKKLREALGDQAENPRFIETLHRRGYRFIAPVEGQLDAPQVTRLPEAEPVKTSPGAGEGSVRAVPRWVTIAGIVAALLAAASVVAWWISPLPAPRVLNYTQLTKDGADKVSVADHRINPTPDRYGRIPSVLYRRAARWQQCHRPGIRDGRRDGRHSHAVPQRWSAWHFAQRVGPARLHVAGK